MHEIRYLIAKKIYDIVKKLIQILFTVLKYMVNGSSQQKKYILFSSSIFYTIFSNALQFEVNNLSPGVEP